VTVRDKNIGGELSQTKSRPKAASQFKPGDRVSGGHRCWLGFPTVSYEPTAAKPKIIIVQVEASGTADWTPTVKPYQSSRTGLVHEIELNVPKNWTVPFAS